MVYDSINYGKIDKKNPYNSNSKLIIIKSIYHG